MDLRRARLGLVAVGLGLLLGTTVAPFASAQETLDELQDEREAVQEDQRETDEVLDALTLDLDVAEAELRRLDQLATDARAAAVQARTDADDAAAEAARSSSSADLATAELGHLERRAAFFAVELYTGNAETRSLEGLLRGDLFADATVDIVMGTVIGENTSFAEQVDDAVDTLTERRDAASSATTRAQELSDEAVRALVVADDAEAEHLAFVVALQERLDHTLAEAEALKELDAELAERIRAREAYLASLLPPRAPGRGNVGPPVGIDQTTVVRGFRVNVEIADQVEGLLAAAEEAGLNLGGGGWRDGASQIELRRAHCGPTEFDIYVRPANECRPPTARPTTSMHERGLALDISNDGVLITTRQNPAYLWLIENAADYGFFNLPSEPWHWSVNGR
ncbi:MAG: M15 family metallopeptidase [Actinomycetota bacterium]